MDPLDQGRIDRDSGLLQHIVTALDLNLPNAGKVNVWCDSAERATFLKWLERRSIAHTTQEGSPVITICDLAHLGLREYPYPGKKARVWQDRKVALENLLMKHHWLIYPVGSALSAQVPAEDISTLGFKKAMASLIYNDLLDYYRMRPHSAEYQIIASLPPNPTGRQEKALFHFFVWLSRKTQYFYRTID